MAAPFIKPESIENGISDLNVTGAIMAFQQLGNFVGNNFIPLKISDSPIPLLFLILITH